MQMREQQITSPTIGAELRATSNEVGLPGKSRPTSSSSGGSDGEAVSGDSAAGVERQPLHVATAVPAVAVGSAPTGSSRLVAQMAGGNGYSDACATISKAHCQSSCEHESHESAPMLALTNGGDGGMFPESDKQDFTKSKLFAAADNRLLEMAVAASVKALSEAQCSHENENTPKKAEEETFPYEPLGRKAAADKRLLKMAATAFAGGIRPGRRSTFVAQQEVELEQLISRALARVGAKDDGDRQARDIISKLNRLYIATTDQLSIIHSDAIRGRLFSALREELRKIANQSAWKRRIAKAKSTQSKPLNKPLLQRFHVARADFTHISDIDQVSQTFHARLFLILRIKNGERDSNLTKDSEDFPFDEDGRLTFRPSAKWYLNQLDFPNGKNITVLDSKVTTDKDDLQIIQRVEGEFFERFELQNFPMDAQDLTITVSVNCATKGPVPVEFVLEPVPGAPPPQLGVDTVNFAYDDIWEINPSVTPEVTDVGANAERRFPAVHLRACVARKPNFVLMNVAFPSAVISLLSLLTFFVSTEELGSRLDLSLTLLLTVVAFKYTSAAYLPQISYWTLIDIFTGLCSATVVLVNIFHSVLGLLADWVGESLEITFMLNKVFFGITATLWTMVQVWFIYWMKIAMVSDTDTGQKRSATNREREPCEDPLTQDISIELSKSGQIVATVGGKRVPMNESVRQALRSSLNRVRRPTMEMESHDEKLDLTTCEDPSDRGGVE
ncbi:hypothetical protein ACHAWF_003744 [Thalassiosira exigua]